MLKKPVISEKSLQMAQNSQYTFLVSKPSTKGSVKQQIEDLFKVTVLSVRIANQKGGQVRTGKTRRLVNLKDFKKAYVTLKPGDSIDYFKLPEKKPKK